MKHSISLSFREAGSLIRLDGPEGRLPQADGFGAKELHIAANEHNSRGKSFCTSLTPLGCPPRAHGMQDNHHGK